MSKIDPALAELKALREHVLLLNMAMVGKGFTLASDTKLRIGRADALIAAGESDQSETWRAEAIEMADLLRLEAGQIGRTPTEVAAAIDTQI